MYLAICVIFQNRLLPWLARCSLINLISFLLSALVVDRQNRQWRASQHAQPSASVWIRVTQWPFANHEPYQQDSQGGTWKPTFTWKRRDVAKHEMNDVFAMKRRVLIALIAWSALGVLGLAYVIRRTIHWASTRF